MIVSRGDIYFEREQIEQVKELPKYARTIYFAIAKTLASKPFGITRAQAEKAINTSLRQLYRIIIRFKQEGISGLIHTSRRPNRSPNKTSDKDKKVILQVRDASGFVPGVIASLIEDNNKKKWISQRVHSSTVYNVLVRSKEIEDWK